MQVYPANNMPNLCKGKRILINNEPIRGVESFDLFIQGSACKALQILDDLMLGK